ncbi:MAG TPA: hypothetical protein PLW43_08685, partial [Chitinophagales bacterium]|nr:hypothetical protein [Chitinophagales bacterium]
MKKILDLTLPPEIGYDENALHRYVKSILHIKDEDAFQLRLLKRSIDARSRQIKINVQAAVYIDDIPEPLFQHQISYRD